MVPLSYVFFHHTWEESLQLPEDFPPVGHGHVPFSRDVPGGEVEDFFQGSLRFEHLSGFGGLPYLPVEPFDGIGGVDDSPEIRRVLEIRGKVSPVVFPAPHADGIGFSPFFLQAIQLPFRDFQGGRPVNGFEVRHEFLGILAAHVLHRVAYLMDHAPLYRHAREHVPDGIGESREPVDAGDANVPHSPVLEIVAYLLPERGGLRIPDVKPEDVLVPFRVDADHEIGSFAFHLGILAHLEMHGVEVDDGVEGFEHASLPLGDEREDGVRYVAHEVRGDFRPVDVPEVGLDIPGGKPEPVHVDDLVFYLQGPGLELGNDFRFEFPAAVPRDLDFGDSLLGEDAFRVTAVSGVPGIVSFRIVLPVSEMGVHFRLEHLFDEGAGEILQESAQFVVRSHFRDDLVHGEAAHGILVEFEGKRGFPMVLRAVAGLDIFHG